MARYRRKFKRKKVYAVAVPKRRYRSMARYRRFRGAGRKAGGMFGGILPPLLGGVADSFINPISPIDGLGSAAIGTFMHNKTTQAIGLYQVGSSLAGMLGFGSGGSGQGGFY